MDHGKIVRTSKIGAGGGGEEKEKRSALELYFKIWIKMNKKGNRIKQVRVIKMHRLAKVQKCKVKSMFKEY